MLCNKYICNCPGFTNTHSTKRLSLHPFLPQKKWMRRQVISLELKKNAMYRLSSVFTFLSA